MGKQELRSFLYANGVPMQDVNWTFSELDNPFLKKKLGPNLEDIDGFLQNRKSLILYFPKNPLLASRLAVTFMKAAFIAGYYKIKYTVPSSLVGCKLEAWDGGDAYNELLTSDLLVVDKITPVKKQDGFPQEVFENFIEDRLLRSRSTILVCGENPNTIFPERLRGILCGLEIKVVTEEGISRVKQ